MRVFALVVALLLALGALSVSWGASVPPVPFKAGATWVYRYTQAAKEQTDTGTLTVVYRGVTEYRGGSHHYFESHSSLAPGIVERDYLIWNGRHFRQAATVLHRGSEVLEIVFDKPYSFAGVTERLDGSTQIFENGTFRAQGSWSIDVTSQGNGKITVPAGRFTVTKWRGTLTIGSLQQSYTVATVGLLEIWAEIDVFVDGTELHKAKLELQQGPVPR